MTAMKRLTNHTKMKVVIGMIVAGVICSVPVAGADSTTFAKESDVKVSTTVPVTRVRANNQQMVRAINVMDRNIDPVIGVKKCERCVRKTAKAAKKKSVK